MTDISSQACATPDETENDGSIFPVESEKDSNPEPRPPDIGLRKPVEPFLFSYQRHAFSELLETARAFEDSDAWDCLPILPRWHKLIIGPTGTGKSHMARALSLKTGWPLLQVTTSNWILQGCSDRGASQTWRHIANWLSRCRSHAIIFLDEIDKVTGEHSWYRCLRAEIFDLLDHRIPPGLRVTGCDGEDSTTDSVVERVLRSRAERQLRARTFIVGASAFQDNWERRAKSLIGFDGKQAEVEDPSLAELSGFLSRELLNRFASRVIVLPPLNLCDYAEMITQSAPKLPSHLRDSFQRLGHRHLDDAMRDQKGCRFIEEVLVEALIGSPAKHAEEPNASQP